MSTIAFKGFDKNMQCRGFQYEIGKTYEHKGAVAACESGFHSCKNPMDVFAYYPPIESRFAVVEAVGTIARHKDDSKIASAEIHIKAELTLPEFIARAVSYMLALCRGGAEVASGAYSNLAASGADSNLAASGAGSNLAASGAYSKLAASGARSKLAASGAGSNVAAAAYGCRAMAGENGAIALAWWDGKRGRFSVAYPGENGIKPDTFYVLNAKGEFQEAA